MSRRPAVKKSSAGRSIGTNVVIDGCSEIKITKMVLSSTLRVPGPIYSVRYRSRLTLVIWLTVLESLGHRLFKEYSGFPLGLENLEKWEGIFQSWKSQGILNRLEKSGKSQGILSRLEKSGEILENKMDQVFSKENKILKKNTGKLGKNTGKVREFCQSGKVGTLILDGLVLSMGNDLGRS